MASFKDLKGFDGIDKLNECVPLIDEIFNDDVFKSSTGTFGELATPIYKNHKEAVDKLFEILGEKPESSISILAGISKLLLEIINDGEVASFFMGTAKNLRSTMYAMRNTKEEQSEDS